MAQTSKAVVLVVMLAAIAGGFTYGWMKGKPETAPESFEAVSWMAREFDLTAEQLAQVERMHAAYRVVCDEHCRVIMESRTQLAQLRERGASAEVLEDAEASVVAADLNCRADLREHVRAVAAAMNGDAGERYLAMIMPKVAEFDHSAAPDLQLNPNHDPDGGEPHH